MKVDITTKNLEINPEHKEYALEKIGALGKYAGSFEDESARAQVEIKKNGDKDYHEQIEVHVQVYVAGGKMLTTVLAGEIEEGIDIACDKIKVQMVKHKEMHQKMSHEKIDPEAIEEAADLGTVNPDEAV